MGMFHIDYDSAWSFVKFSRSFPDYILVGRGPMRPDVPGVLTVII